MYKDNYFVMQFIDVNITDLIKSISQTASTINLLNLDFTEIYAQLGYLLNDMEDDNVENNGYAVWF